MDTDFVEDNTILKYECKMKREVQDFVVKMHNLIGIEKEKDTSQYRLQEYNSWRRNQTLASLAKTLVISQMCRLFLLIIINHSFFSKAPWLAWMAYKLTNCPLSWHKIWLAPSSWTAVRDQEKKTVHQTCHFSNRLSPEKSQVMTSRHSTQEECTPPSPLG